MTLNLNALQPTSTRHATGADTAAAGQPAAPTYAGVLSFMRRPYTRDLTGVDVAVSGIPLDLATTFRPGTRFGPAGMRAASVQLADLGAFPWGIDPFDHLNVVDYGDCWFDAHNPLGIRDAPTYLTFDIDCLDPAFAPGTGTPVAGGLSSAQALEIVRALGAVNLVGADVVEVSPPYDHSDVTALAAAHLAADMLCLMRNQKLQRHQRM
jgi:arginase family enzyme